MDLSELTSLIATPARLKAIGRAIGDANAGTAVQFCGLAGSASSILLGSLIADSLKGHTVTVIGSDSDDAGYIYSDLTALLGTDKVSFFPSGYKRSIRYGMVDSDAVIMRTEALNALGVIVTYPEAIAERVATRENVEQSTLHIKLHQPITLTQISERLLEFGFSEVDYVYEPGQFAMRGSIMDVFSYANERPYRLEFGWGDEIESIRLFDVETQLSTEKVEELSIVNNCSKADTQTYSLLDYILSNRREGEDTPVIISHLSHDMLMERVRTVTQYTSLSDSSLISTECDRTALDNLIDYDSFCSAMEQYRRVEYSAEAGLKEGCQGIAFDFSPQGSYHKNFQLISEAFTEHLKEGYKLYILSDSPKQIERLKAIFADRGDNIRFNPVEQTLHEGFVDHQRKLCVFTDHQIFDRFHKYTLRANATGRNGKLALSLKELSQLEVGDYVVHINHGIGKFGGLIRVPRNGQMQEMIKVVYLNNDFITMSIHSLYKLSKYRGKEGVEPRLSKLGSGAWEKMKSRTKSKLKDIARDLIQLYAQRREQQGHAFLPDGSLQHELEASFIYEDTPDQLRATQDVKRDMESNRPMDRLICGDVGFGKTEVAIRAAFKAANEGKQTAVLVPTTVLAYQHYNTFSARLKDFPVRVEYLSRARTAKQVKEILTELAEGHIDIIIGTHKLIGKSVKFKDLGLLVIDEEQKFGVSTKEKLKQLKVNVDTLTLSATPIPRTLQFSLMGARDLTAITTPPPNRYPILTTISTFSDETISEALNFELARSGQVFFINNRIEQLYGIEQTIHRLVPNARVVLGHGQMPPEQLEKAIIDFANHDYDILLSTTIVESGIDMPNVNTIIINNAQGFGLSELHQLRGRVGRSNRKAFCYLLVPPGKPLTPVALRRLRTIESFSDLGSGIQIAMQDLDIRGAGNLLGAEQSGFIAELGYETYQRILKEAVIELRTQEFADTFSEEVQRDDMDFVADCNVDTDIVALLPATYVPQESERILLYQQLDNMQSEEQLTQFRARLVDRFGKIPYEALELIRIVSLRRTARTLGIEKIILRGSKMTMYFAESEAYFSSPAFGRILQYMQRHVTTTHFMEKNQRRAMYIDDVTSIAQSLDIINEIASLEPIQ